MAQIRTAETAVSVALREARTHRSITSEVIASAIDSIAFNSALLSSHILRRKQRHSAEAARTEAAVELVLVYNQAVNEARAQRPNHGWLMPQIAVPAGEMTSQSLVTISYQTIDGASHSAALPIDRIVTDKSNYETFATAVRGSYAGYSPVNPAILRTPHHA